MKIAIYGRVSTDDKEQNPERQILKCKQYCELQNHEVVQIVTEEHKGDSNPLYRKGFKQINLKKVDGVVIETIDRLTRQHPTKVMNLLSYFKESGIKIISVREPIFNMESDMSDLMQYLLSWWNNYFLKKLSKDVKSGLDRAVANGKTLGRPETKINKYEVLRQLKDKVSLRTIADDLETSLGKIQRVKKKLEEENLI